MKESLLDRHWNELMLLCNRETDFKNNGKHPKLLKYISDQVDERARAMGFGDRQIRSRDFRAERQNGHITRLLTD
jgi:hypothetical protein